MTKKKGLKKSVLAYLQGKINQNVHDQLLLSHDKTDFFQHPLSVFPHNVSLRNQSFEQINIRLHLSSQCLILRIVSFDSCVQLWSEESIVVRFWPGSIGSPLRWRCWRCWRCWSCHSWFAGVQASAWSLLWNNWALLHLHWCLSQSQSPVGLEI